MAKRVKKPRTKPTIKPGSKARKKRPKVVNPKRFETRTYILEHFRKSNKKPPVRYRRAVPRDMSKIKFTTMSDTKINTGSLVEFKYGRKQKPGQIGGWKNDPIPVLFVFHDDKIKYIEGINTNYLSEYYLKRVRTIMNRFPGVEGDILYNIFKRTAKPAIKKGYRKYIRKSFRDVYLYVYKDDIERTIDALAKSNTSQMKIANKSKNPGAEG